MIKPSPSWIAYQLFLMPASFQLKFENKFNSSKYGNLISLGFSILKVFLKVIYEGIIVSIRSPEKLHTNVPIAVNIETKNQEDALEPILQEMLHRNLKFEIFSSSSDQGIFRTSIRNISLKQYVTILGLVNFISYFLKEWRSEVNKRYFYNIAFYRIVSACGIYICYRKLFKNSNVKIAIYSNDHSPDSRAFFLAARDEGIKTVYIPHASITNLFPPLECDIAFLEGEDMKNKYEQISPIRESEVFLIGSPKLNNFIIKNKQLSQTIKTNFLTIGVAYNLLDDSRKIINLIDTILEDSRLEEAQVIIRPHPRIKKPIKVSSGRVSYSNALEEVAYEYLSKLDVLISGPSNIILEAISLKIPTMQFMFSDKLLDSYDFCSKGLIQKIFKNIEDVIEAIYTKSVENYCNFDQASYYNAQLENQIPKQSSSHLVVNILEKHLN